VHGNGDPDTIRLAVELAALQRQCGDLPAARRLLAVAHSAARSAFADDHPLTRVVEFELTEVEPPMPVGLDATGRHGPRGVLRRGAHEPRALPVAPVSPAVPAPVSPPVPVSPPAPAIPRQRTPASMPTPSPLARPVYAEPAPVVSRPAWETRPVRRRGWSAGQWRIVAVPLSVVVVLVVAAAVALSRGGGSTPATDPGSAPVGQSIGAKAGGPAATPRPSRSRAAATSPPRTTSAPAPPSYPPPTAVTVRDDRRSLTVTWTDLSEGVARAVVTIGRPGHAPIIVAPVAVGVNHFTLTGVSPDFDYCATVALIYGPGEANQVAADPVCTRRAVSPNGRRA
jgi:hypothetical protein